MIDLQADPQIVRLVAEGERLAHSHLFNSAFATETSLIDPLPHQRIAVYDHMLGQPRLRFLLADDAGAGKTIMAGLYVREMLSRRLARRILIVPPAGLVGNWKSEMAKLFQLPFEIVDGADARATNPFVGEGSDLLIVSVDTLAAGRTLGRMAEPEVEPYDLVILDEAHKLSADREPDFSVRRTDRYRLAEQLAGAAGDEQRLKPCHHLLLLTATPHMGKEYPYYCLWHLLEPEVLSTLDAFNSYPPDARARHFLRRTKEEMVRFNGSPIYPERESRTVSFELTQGPDSEQELYDETTSYIETYYNLAALLNRSAVRLAMSVFQRRLASSTWALLRSLERRLTKLDTWIERVQSGEVDAEQLAAQQRRLDNLRDTFSEKTADEESGEEGQEENERTEDEAMGALVVRSLADLKTERDEVSRLLALAQRVHERGDESKFEKLRELLADPDFAGEKLLIFTEHRDTLEFLVRRLGGLGYAEEIATIHGGLDYTEREAQVERFRGPCRFLVATDAAGEGINLQFCWALVNWDIPWNPARIEQRMGRLHRYKQTHRVVLLNLVAGQTREGRVLKTLLDKLERIRKELQSDKVFDVIGLQFAGVSLPDLIRQATIEHDADGAVARLEGMLTPEQARARIAARDKLLETGGDVKSQLPEQRARLEREVYQRLLPGYVLRFLQRSAPLLGVKLTEEGEGYFAFAGLPERLLPLYESYPPELRRRFTVQRPAEGEPAIYLHPGERFFDAYREHFCARFGDDALRGAIFADPLAERPYFFHVACVQVARAADPDLVEAYGREEIIEERLLGFRHEVGGAMEEYPVEALMLLEPPATVSASQWALAAKAEASREEARLSALRQAQTSAAEHRSALAATLGDREQFLRRGYAYQEAELAERRSRLRASPEARDRGEVTAVKQQQQALAQRRDRALAVLRHEPDLIEGRFLYFVAHALVVPSSDPVDRERHDKEIEAIAVRVATSYEESLGAVVEDVSDPRRAMGFDLLSHRPNEDPLSIEVKGRRAIGDVQLSENEWARAANLRDRYWLYVVYDCASASPRLLRIQDPFSKLLLNVRFRVTIDQAEVFAAA
ncbi:MAG: DUF3883 domain-containing protein, partial [Armatimonadetes bacterium]|nr:DUF3883 domain-containing protein [Armatimonadota bacterium]